LGPEFVLLRDEFVNAHKHLRRRDGTIKRILVSFGGCDLTNETAKTLHALRLLNRQDIKVCVVVGKSNPYKAAIKKECAKIEGVRYYCQVSNMAEMIAQADLAIGSGGTTTWERCYLELPALVISQAANQEPISRHCADNGLVVYLGRSQDVSARDIAARIAEFCGCTRIAQTMIRAMRSVRIGNENGKLIQRITAP
jgi:UDP-2,4-diacetamido-2,4,6-trideoxy-beta-L-altropyranose hydrolase